MKILFVVFAVLILIVLGVIALAIVAYVDSAPCVVGSSRFCEPNVTTTTIPSAP